MRRGDFAAAWEISDCVLRSGPGDQSPHTPRHLQRVWDGTPLAGRRVLIRCYHGLGDTIQFIRYAPMVAAIAREVIVWAQPELVSLVRSVKGVDRVLALHDGLPEADYEVDIEIMELPHYFRTSVDDIPADVPYLRTAGMPAVRAHDKGRLDIGLIWKAGDWDGLRSVPLPLLAPLRDIPGIRLHALQRGSGLAEWRNEYGPVSGTDCAGEAAIAIQALDLVISVDSFPAHLAGALGVPTWTLLHATPDWRWMDGRGDSPWYPAMRLFRQEQPGDWAPVIARVATQLQALLEQRA